MLRAGPETNNPANPNHSPSSNPGLPCPFLSLITSFTRDEEHESVETRSRVPQIRRATGPAQLTIRDQTMSKAGFDIGIYPS
jgi:hypothetical protein